MISGKTPRFCDSLASSKSHKSVYGHWHANIENITSIYNPCKQGRAEATYTGFLIGPDWYSWMHIHGPNAWLTTERIFSRPHSLEITWRLETMHMRKGILLKSMCMWQLPVLFGGSQSQTNLSGFIHSYIFPTRFILHVNVKPGQQVKDKTFWGFFLVFFFVLFFASP